jgi:hypothetical protein
VGFTVLLGYDIDQWSFHHITWGASWRNNFYGLRYPFWTALGGMKHTGVVEHLNLSVPGRFYGQRYGCNVELLMKNMRPYGLMDTIMLKSCISDGALLE